jgi:hypothetical protein
MPHHFGSALVLSLVVVACRGDTKDSDPLAQDTTFARELGMAMADSLEKPVMTPLIGASQASSATAAAPLPSGRNQSVGSDRGSKASARAASAARSTGEPEPPSPRVSSSSRSARSPTAAATDTSDRGVSSSGETPRRSTASQHDSSSRDQLSPAAPATGTRTATTPTSAPRTSSRSASSGTIPAGTALALSSDATICTNTHKVGQRFAAALIQGVQASDGSTIPSGARAVLEITQLKRSEEAGDPIEMGFRVTSIASAGRVFSVDAPAQSASIARVRKQSRTSDAQKVAAGAALGAAVGQAVGQDAKSTVTGAAAGAAVGAAAAQASASYEGCVPAGGRINATVAD